MMTMKKARSNGAYVALAEKAIELLEAKASFSHDEILEACNYVGLEIEWQFVRQIVEDDYGESLVPVAASYFKRRRAGDDPGRYLAYGRGKKTAGYIIARDRHGPLIKRQMQVRRNQIAGAAAAFNGERIRAIAQTDVIKDIPLLTIEDEPPIELPQIAPPQG